MTQLVVKNREGIYVQVNTFLLGTHRQGVGTNEPMSLFSEKESKEAMRSHLKHDNGYRPSSKTKRAKELGW